MKRLNHASQALLTLAALSLLAPASAVRGQSITITDPAPGATVNLPAGNSPWEIKATIPTDFQPKYAKFQYTDTDGSTVTLTAYQTIQDLMDKTKYTFRISYGTGTRTGTVYVKAVKPADSGGNPEVPITSSSGGITVTR